MVVPVVLEGRIENGMMVLPPLPDVPNGTPVRLLIGVDLPWEFETEMRDWQALGFDARAKIEQWEKDPSSLDP